MSGFLYNLGIIADWLFLGTWRVAVSPIALGMFIAVAAGVVVRLCPRLGLIYLALSVSVVSAVAHVILITATRGISPMILFGLIAGVIAIFPVALFFAVVFRAISALMRKERTPSHP